MTEIVTPEYTVAERRTAPLNECITNGEHDAICAKSQAALLVDTNTLHRRMDDVTVRMSALEGKVEDVKDTVQEVAGRFTDIDKAIVKNSADTAEVLEIVTTAKGFFKSLGWLGEGVKWLAAVSAAIVGFWVIVKGGSPK